MAHSLMMMKVNKMLLKRKSKLQEGLTVPSLTEERANKILKVPKLTGIVLRKDLSI